MIPKHLSEPLTTQTYFVTSTTEQRRATFQAEAWARVFLKTLHHYRRQQNYQLHAFVLMPDHFHLLITPAQDATLEKAMQLIKGGTSFQLKQAGRTGPTVWQKGFTDRRVRNAEEYRGFVEYIHQNPVVRGLVEKPVLFRYCSAYPGYKLDPVRPYLSG